MHDQPSYNVCFLPVSLHQLFPSHHKQLLAISLGAAADASEVILYFAVPLHMFFFLSASQDVKRVNGDLILLYRPAILLDCLQDRNLLVPLGISSVLLPVVSHFFHTVPRSVPDQNYLVDLLFVLDHLPDLIKEYFYGLSSGASFGLDLGEEGFQVRRLAGVLRAFYDILDIGVVVPVGHDFVHKAAVRHRLLDDLLGASDGVLDDTEKSGEGGTH